MTTHSRRNNATIALLAVVSSQLAAVGYDAPSQTLAVRFTPKPGEKEGPLYYYYDFPQSEHDKLDEIAQENRKGNTDASVGSFFYKNVKPVYAFQRIEPDVGPVKARGEDGQFHVVEGEEQSQESRAAA